MAELDYQYIAGLVKSALGGSSDAFAELYAATYQKEYHFAYCYLKDSYLAQDALQETYILALKNLASLKDPKLFVSWLNQINFRVCFGMAAKQSKYNAEMATYASGDFQNSASTGQKPEDNVIRVDSEQYLLKQVLALPYSESQAIFLHYYKNVRIDEIAYLLEVSKSTVKRHLASGKKRLANRLN